MRFCVKCKEVFGTGRANYCFQCGVRTKDTCELTKREMNSIKKTSIIPK